MKPADVFDRDGEWGALERYVDAPGAALGLVYGRRRQGKTYLLDAFAEARGGLYIAALQQSGAQNLVRISEAYGRYLDLGAPVRFSSWEQAMAALVGLGDRRGSAVPVVLDEFPYLLGDAPQLPSVIQDALRPRRGGAPSQTRLILCGSALATMRGLLAGTAPLRGRASLELVVRPFDFRDAAVFWGVDHDPELALRLHALVGGTPAYRSMAGGAAPRTVSRLDEWVCRTLLDPASAMYREGNVLLAQEDQITDTAGYLAVLAAISQGATRRGAITAAVGRSHGALGHALSVLTEAGLVTLQEDALRDRRASFRVAEPIMRLHQLVIAPNQAALDRGRAAAVWAEAADTVSAGIYGPHFEEITRLWCRDHAAVATLGGTASSVAPTVLACPEHRVGHEVDVVVTERRAQGPRRVIAVGEAKWRSERTGRAQLERLDHVRELLGAPDARILLFSRAGFTAQLASDARARTDVELVSPARLYTGS